MALARTESASEDPAILPDAAYRPVPHADRAGEDGPRPVWRVRFDVLNEPGGIFGLDINGEVIFGREMGQPDVIDLSDYNAKKLGVSRQHVQLRPTDSQLFVLDLGSTNGTLRNAHLIGANTPYSLNSGDVLTLGQLQLMINIIKRPKSDTSALRDKANLGDVLTDMVKAIASQLETDQVLSQAVEAAMALVSASETAVWLVDEGSGELYLEAECGVQDEEIRHMRLQVSDALVGRVIETGDSLRINREGEGTPPFEGMSSSRVASMIYVPVTQGGVTFGVLAAAHREAGRRFTDRDQSVLESIADFAAIAIQNARVYQAAEQAMERRVKELAAVNELSRAVSASLDPRQVYRVLTEQVQKHWGVTTVLLWMVDEGTKKASLASDSRGTEKGGGRAYRVTQEIVNRVVQTGEAVLLSDLMRQAPDIDANDTQQIRSEIAVPINLQGKVIGVLDVQSPDVNHFKQPDVEALQTAADQLALAIQNAQLYKQVQHHAEQLEQRVDRGTQDLNVAHEHLETISRLKDEFIANVSHQLRTPITNLKLLQNVLRTAPARRRERYMDAMQRETLRLERIVEDLFRLSRLDQGQVPYEPTPVDLNKLIQQYVQDRAPMAESRGLTLTYASQGRLPEVMADPGLLGQTLSVLITNALNYTPSGGEVWVSTHTERDEEQQQWIGFRVSDTGPGVLPEEQPYLFERFYRGKAGHESGSSGAGLGLAIVKEIVELHDGRVEISSEGVPGQGAQFSVWLPLKGLEKANLLLVDDNETLLEVMKEILSAVGHEIWAARSGEDALKKARVATSAGSNLHLIITDVVMPGMNGVQLLEEVRAQPELADIPFLFISASTTLAMEGQIAGLENVTFLRKPFDSQTLQDTVMAALGTQSGGAKRMPPD